MAPVWLTLLLSPQIGLTAGNKAHREKELRCDGVLAYTAIIDYRAHICMYTESLVCVTKMGQILESQFRRRVFLCFI